MVNLREEFIAKVIEPFAAAYQEGMTPNPCILCNKHIKFPYLLKIADERGATAIATGHYARIERIDELEIRKSSDSSLITRHSSRLLKGVDNRKDQSYVLYVLRQEELARLVLPLGEKRKEEVRRIARRLDLSAADRPESQEICFIEEKNYFSFIGNLFRDEKGQGDIIDVESGKVLGSHKGIHTYTIGQRKGLGISSPEPLYVVKIDAEKNVIYVGPKDRARIREFSVEDINWLVDRNTSAKTRSELRASVRVRSTMKDEPATITMLAGNRGEVVFDKPQWAPAPGQSAVFYDDDIVIGGGVISK